MWLLILIGGTGFLLGLTATALMVAASKGTDCENCSAYWHYAHTAEDEK